jgi:hypothetical protein
MKLETIFLAHFAALTPDGLFTVHGGGLNRINVESFPWAWGLLYLFARIRLTPKEAREEHTLTAEQESPNGQVEALGDPEPFSRFSPPLETGPDGMLGLSFSLGMVNRTFSEPGVYKFRVRIDGREIGVVQLLVAVKGEQGR